MKRKIAIIILLCFICIASYFVWVILPKEVNQSFDGYLYGLGEKKKSINEKVTIRVKGKLRNKMFENDRFKGTIDIKGDVPPFVKIDQKEVEIVFNEDNSGLIILNDYSNWLDINNYGTLYISKDFSQLTILVYEEEPKGTNGWSTSDGIMISAPAKSREEALSISNHLMKNLFNGNGKKSLEDFNR
ncbi:hypothetical protein [Gottfriedia solisilvae]|uniref:hypothetical protein n=1 Tax=Gottfriedia solisilvae TaxID=1516104 RepID=UPI003D2EFFD6